MKLETEKRVLANSEKLFGAATAAYQALYEDDAAALTISLRRASSWKSWRDLTPSFWSRWPRWSRQGGD